MSSCCPQPVSLECQQVVLRPGMGLAASCWCWNTFHNDICILQVLWAHVWGVAFLGERESWPGLLGSVLLAAGVVSVSSSKANAPEPGPDETTAFVTSMQSKAPDFEDLRITMADGVQSDEWHDNPDKATQDDLEIQMRSETKS